MRNDETRREVLELFCEVISCFVVAINDENG
jgi:hypothetical protein